MTQQQMDEMRQEAEDLQSGNTNAMLHDFDEKHKILEILNQKLTNGSVVVAASNAITSNKQVSSNGSSSTSHAIGNGNNNL